MASSETNLLIMFEWIVVIQGRGGWYFKLGSAAQFLEESDIVGRGAELI